MFNNEKMTNTINYIILTKMHALSHKRGISTWFEHIKNLDGLADVKNKLSLMYSTEALSFSIFERARYGREPFDMLQAHCDGYLTEEQYRTFSTHVNQENHINFVYISTWERCNSVGGKLYDFDQNNISNLENINSLVICYDGIPISSINFEAEDDCNMTTGSIYTSSRNNPQSISFGLVDNSNNLIFKKTEKLYRASWFAKLFGGCDKMINVHVPLEVNIRISDESLAMVSDLTGYDDLINKIILMDKID